MSSPRQARAGNGWPPVLVGQWTPPGFLCHSHPFVALLVPSASSGPLPWFSLPPSSPSAISGHFPTSVALDSPNSEPFQVKSGVGDGTGALFMQ